MQKKATGLFKLMAATMYSYTSPQSKAKVSKLWRKASRLNLILRKATVVHKQLTSLSYKIAFSGAEICRDGIRIYIG